MCDEHWRMDRELKHLIAQACAAPRRSSQRQKCLTALYNLVVRSNRLIRRNSPGYEDALHNTWLYVCHKPENYNPAKAEVIAWINGNLKFRLIDENINRQMDNSKRYLDPDDNRDPLDNVPAQPEIPPMIENVLRWIKTDPQKILQRTHIKGRPDVNAQILLLERFPPENRWEYISETFSIPQSTAAMFYRRKCFPLLREFGQKEGYLDDPVSLDVQLGQGESATHKGQDDFELLDSMNSQEKPKNLSLLNNPKDKANSMTLK